MGIERGVFGIGGSLGMTQLEYLRINSEVHMLIRISLGNLLGTDGNISWFSEDWQDQYCLSVWVPASGRYSLFVLVMCAQKGACPPQDTPLAL